MEKNDADKEFEKFVSDPKFGMLEKAVRFVNKKERDESEAVRLEEEKKKKKEDASIWDTLFSRE